MGRDNNQNLFSGSQENEHFEVRFPCDECEYVANKKVNLKQHKEAHDEIFYPCAKCEYVATSSFNLKIHTRTMHRGIVYHCNKCEYLATLNNNSTRTQRSHL